MPWRSAPVRIGRLASVAAILVAVFGATRLMAAAPAAGEVTGDPAEDLGDDSGRGPPGTPASSQARGAGHETEDMDGGLMGRLALLLGVVVLVMVIGMVGLRRFVVSVQTQGPPLTLQQTTGVAPPPPNLQADPPLDLARLRARENTLLSSYAWADAGHARARIPIERAMSLLVGRTLDPAP